VASTRPLSIVEKAGGWGEDDSWSHLAAQILSTLAAIMTHGLPKDPLTNARVNGKNEIILCFEMLGQ
jgi:hypothetical protein